MRVAVVGSRGMPGVPGGIERHVEELYPRLSALGVEVTVYARRDYVPRDCLYRGVRVKTLPSAPGRYGETISHTALALLYATGRGYDLLHIHAIGPGSLVPLAHGLGLRPVVFTFHAADYLRAKWGAGARTFLRSAERVAVRHADAVIAVAEGDARRLERDHGRTVVTIPNGPGKVTRRPPGRFLDRLGLEPGAYILSVSRLTPEKRIEDLLAAARLGLPGTKLVVAGDTSFTDEYIRRLKTLAGPDVVFPGYVQGPDLDELLSSALMYVIPSELEGLPVSLLEAMSIGLPVVASRIPGNIEALGDPPAGLVFPPRDVEALAHCLANVAGDAILRERLGTAAQHRIHDEFDWDKIARRTLDVYEKTLAGRPPGTGS